jgi:hypothetical protein
VTIALLVVVILLALSLTWLAVTHLRYRRQPEKRLPAAGGRRILFPFIANALSPRALDASLRLARAEEATLVPVFLARVPLQLPLDTPLPRQSNIAIPLQEAIERRATKFGIAVARNNPGFDSEDIAWILKNAPGEILVLRPDHEQVLTVPTKKLGKSPRRGRRESSRVVRPRAPGSDPLATRDLHWNKT